MKMLIIIPAYNEARNICSVIDDIRSEVPGADMLVIDDGSSDATRAFAASKGVPVVTLPFNLGIGAAVQTGYLYAAKKGYDIAVQFDGDGQHIAGQIPHLVAPVLADEADVVVGSRFLVKKAYEAELSRMAGIKILSRIVSALIGQRMTDPTSGFRAANRQAIAFYCRNYPDDYPEPEALVLLHRAGFRLAEVPVLMRRRLLGDSSITFLRAFYYMIKVILAIMIDMMKAPAR